jgi:hypothetical protein
MDEDHDANKEPGHQSWKNMGYPARGRRPNGSASLRALPTHQKESPDKATRLIAIQ